jgi:nicotinate-nucleotide--dimethylbenzimidazole phosphoribosyltransferase
MDSDMVVGRGAGLTDEQYQNKKRIVKKSIEINGTDKNDVIDILSKVGGFDIAAMCGCFLGAARRRVPVVIDGFISSTAALCAYRLNSFSRDYMFASHLSAEPGSKYILDELGLSPILDLKMRLGEGSGCPLAFMIIEAALHTMNNMGSFKDAEINDDFLIDIR